MLNANEKTILFLGDSLTEGFGVEQDEAYPTLVQELIAKKLNQKVTIINGGVSGSTTSDGLARLKWYLKRKPSLIMVALGANDGLRGHDLNKSQANLEAIIVHAKDSGAKVLLAGMLVPPNYGEEYAKQFKAMYETLQTKYQLKALPFLLEGIAGKKEYNQADGIHPNAKGHELMAKKVFEFIKEEL
ncbi:MAG: arylesterase [Campylobacterota bacterium]|nr:arylesterase [Campylobacterota bacterium]